MWPLLPPTALPIRVDSTVIEGKLEAGKTNSWGLNTLELETSRFGLGLKRLGKSEPDADSNVSQSGCFLASQCFGGVFYETIL